MKAVFALMFAAAVLLSLSGEAKAAGPLWCYRISNGIYTWVYLINSPGRCTSVGGVWIKGGHSYTYKVPI